MHAERTENLCQRELKLFFFLVSCMVLLTSLRPVVPKNERLFVDDIYCFKALWSPSIKNTPENAVKSVPCLLCQRKAYIYTAKGGYLKTMLFVNFVPQNQVYILDYAFRSIVLRLTSM